MCVVQHGEEIQTLQKRITHLETDLEQAKTQLTETNEKLEDANKNLTNVRTALHLHGGTKNGALFSCAITLPNINRFSQLFRCLN